MKNFPIKHEGKEYWISRAIAVAVFISTSDDIHRYILAIKRGKGTPDYQGCWCCPCGYLDFDESLEECAIREVYEETGIKINKSGLRLFYVESDPKESNKQNVTCRYDAIIDYCEPKITGIEKDEVEEIKWIKITELDNYKWAFGHKKIIKELYYLK